MTEPEYRVDAALYFMNDGGHYLFVRHEGQQRTAKFVTASDVGAAFTQKEIDSGWMPAGVLRFGHNARGPWYVYSAPAQRVTVRIDAQDLEIPIPRTVLVAANGQYRLWALKAKHFEADALTFQAPFPNVYGDGRICWGQNATPAIQVNKARQAWELFFVAPFNGDLVNGKSRQHERDVRALLRTLDGKRTYPADDLVNVRGSIGHLVAEAIR